MSAIAVGICAEEAVREFSICFDAVIGCQATKKSVRCAREGPAW